jgi:hypothetical protein
MKSIVVILSMVLLMLGAGIMLVGCRNSNPTAYTTGLERYDLSDSEVSKLEPRAKAGDRKAAKKLMLYYGYVRRDNEAFEQWRKLAEP